MSECIKCGKYIVPCVPTHTCVDCFGEYTGTIGPLHSMGLSQADKAWGEKECPLEVQLAAMEAENKVLREGLEEIKKCADELGPFWIEQAVSQVLDSCNPKEGNDC